MNKISSKLQTRINGKSQRTPDLLVKFKTNPGGV